MIKTPICAMPPRDQQAGFVRQIYALGYKRRGLPVEEGVVQFMEAALEYEFCYIQIKATLDGNLLCLRSNGGPSFTLFNSHRHLIEYLRRLKA